VSSILVLLFMPFQRLFVEAVSCTGTDTKHTIKTMQNPLNAIKLR